MTFEEWKKFYGWEYTTKAQLKELVEEGALTKEQYKEITGEDMNPVAEPIKSIPKVENSNTTNINSTVAANPVADIKDNTSINKETDPKVKVTKNEVAKSPLGFLNN